MRESIQIFVHDLLKIKNLHPAWEEAQLDGVADLPTVVLGYFGRAISDCYQALSKPQIEEICLEIENAVVSNDQYLADAVATGLLEALFSRANKTPLLWSMIELNLLPKSKEYIELWTNQPT